MTMSMTKKKSLIFATTLCKAVTARPIFVASNIELFDHILQKLLQQVSCETPYRIWPAVEDGSRELALGPVALVQQVLDRHGEPLAHLFDIRRHVQALDVTHEADHGCHRYSGQIADLHMIKSANVST